MPIFIGRPGEIVGFDGTSFKKVTATDVAAKRGLDVFVAGGALQVISNAPTTTITPVSSVSETSITASAGQQAVTITALEAGKIHYAFETGVSTSNAFIDLGDQLIIRDFAATVFLLAASGTPDVQVDRFIRI